MAVEWQAPCGCIIEFDGQLVDKGAPIKRHKVQCARHTRPTPDEAADVAFDDCKQRERVRAEILETNSVLGLTNDDVTLSYGPTGPLNVVVLKQLNANQQRQLTDALAAKFGSNAVISYG